ncbi:M20/M25/M40 family metallo-hydrolase [Sphingomonas sp. PR090111-T3T-6A]|uniref:M20/M25/M40 family metallo-hydrolase n=1 Tax=Sphingomonas sp. PR090111-T3T-6A TaxID=685778 RepID=UPI0012FC626D|nr:M20/M25/M40 family metallo-hydrolase [Sphingomonas sp. PR090111-T3T-6A]
MALLLAVAVTLFACIRAAMPPPVVPASAPPTVFSAGRAMADVHAIAMRPHPTGSADNARVREHLVARLRALGLAPEERRYLIDPRGAKTLRRWTGAEVISNDVVNVLAVLPGRDRTLPAVALMAHYDTVWGSPGSGDDSIGVASALEILRAIKARGVPARDVVVLFTDGEEIGLSGARAFWPHDGAAGHVGVVVNLEARGAGGRATMFETGAGNGAMMALFAKSVAHPVANSLSVMAYRRMPNDTDFTPVREKGLPGFNFAIMGRPQYYHSPRATIDRLDPRSMQDMGDQALGIVSALAFAAALPARSTDAVFFDTGGAGMIHYGVATGWWLLIGAAVALIGAGLGARRAGLLSLRSVCEGLALPVWLASHATLALNALNLLSGSTRHPNYYDRLAALPMLEAQAVLAGMALLGGLFLLRRSSYRAVGLVPILALALLDLVLGGRLGLVPPCVLAGMIAAWSAPRAGSGLWGSWLALIGVLLLGALGAQVGASLAAWLLAVPALVLALVALIVAWMDASFARGAGWAVVAGGAAVVSAPLLPLAHLAFLGIGAGLPEMVALFLLVLAAAFWPLARYERAPRWALVALAVLLVMAGAIAVHVRTDPIAPTVPAYSLDK